MNTYDLNREQIVKICDDQQEYIDALKTALFHVLLQWKMYADEERDREGWPRLEKANDEEAKSYQEIKAMLRGGD